MASIHDKENNPQCEKIHIVGLVWSLLEDFWSHVAWGSNSTGVASASISASNVASESKVNDLDFILLTEHDVLWLQISVGHTIFVEIVKSSEHLLEVVTRESLVESTTVGNVVKEFSSSDWLHGNVGDFLFVPVFFHFSSLHVTVVVLHDVVVIEVLAVAEFSVDQVEHVLVDVTLSEIEHLQGGLLAIINVLAKLGCG